MTENVDVIGAIGPGGVNGSLNRPVQSIPGRISGKVVNEFAGVVLEDRGGGGDECVRRRNADESDLNVRSFHNDVGGQDQAVFPGEIAADIGKFGKFRQFHELVHAVIKLMVARHGNIVVQSVHQADHGLSLAQSADGLALNGVPVIHKNGGIALCFHIVPNLLQTGISETVLQSAVYVTREQNHHVPVLLRYRILRRNGFICTGGLRIRRG